MAVPSTRLIHAFLAVKPESPRLPFHLHIQPGDERPLVPGERIRASTDEHACGDSIEPCIEPAGNGVADRLNCRTLHPTGPGRTAIVRKGQCYVMGIGGFIRIGRMLENIGTTEFGNIRKRGENDWKTVENVRVSAESAWMGEKNGASGENSAWMDGGE